MFKIGEIYEFKEDYNVDNIVYIYKGTRIKVVDPGPVVLGFEFPRYICGFHNCCGKTKEGYGYYISSGKVKELLRKVIIKKNNMEVYKNA